MFRTIRQTAKQEVVPEGLIRRLVAQGKCPGIYSGNRFLVNVEALMEQLDKQSRETVQAQ